MRKPLVICASIAPVGGDCAGEQMTGTALRTMPESKDEFEADASASTQGTDAKPRKPRRWQPSSAVRNILMVVVGLVAFVAVSGVVLYQPLRYGDAIENFGIVMMLTVPVIAAVAFRVALDSWVDAE
jgi:hypothetical protein